MTIEQIDKIDIIGVEKASGALVLTISDHLDWSDEGSHLLALQEKINAYVGFIETGALVNAYPDSAGRGIKIDIVALEPLPPIGVSFIEKVEAVLAPIGITIGHRGLIA